MSQTTTRARTSSPRVAGRQAHAAAHVLVADRNAATRAARQQQLVAAGARVSLARTGFEAIVKASCHVPDLILLDPSVEAAETGHLLTTCPVTAHIPVLQLEPGRRLPRRVLDHVRRR